MHGKEKAFFLLRRALFYSSIALAVLFVASSTASRFYPSPIGLSLVASGSMEPGIRVLDIVVYTPLAPASVGDVVVWCSSPAFCVVHRLVNLSDTYIVTKGDANPAEDSPVPRGFLRGRAVLVVPREAWVGALAAALGYYLASSIRSRRASIDPVSLASLVLIASVSFMALFVFLPSTPPVEAPPAQPVTYLSTYSLDPSSCVASISYTRELEVASIRVLVNGSPAPVNLSPNTASVALDPGLLSRAYSVGGYIEVQAEAELARNGTVYAHMVGRYLAKLTAPPPRITTNSSGVYVENPNCFPVEVNITYLYAYRPGEPWRYSTEAIGVPGWGRAWAPAPEAPYVYVDVKYVAWGVERWERLAIRP